MPAIINGPHDAFLCQAFSALIEKRIAAFMPEKAARFSKCAKISGGFPSYFMDAFN